MPHHASGSFFYTWKLGPLANVAEYEINFDLKSLIQYKALPPPSTVDTSEICPSQPLQLCPSYLWPVDWDETCKTFGTACSFAV